MGNKTDRNGCCSDGRMTGNVGLRGSVSTWIVALGAVLFATAGPALGQFAVQPMKLDLQVTSGKILPQVINIRNTDATASHTIKLSLVDLTQDEFGGWRIIDPNEPNPDIDMTKLASLRDSITLPTESVTLDPLQTIPVQIMVKVPRRARGFSCAGILATLEPRVGADRSVVFGLRFVVPVIVQVEGRARRHKVAAEDIGLEFVPAGVRGPGSPATTQLWMVLENTGPTFPRTRPLARIWSWAGGHWRIVTTTAFEDMGENIGIIPGARIKVRTDLQKSLPSGKYRIHGELYVDGRRTKRVTKEIEFAGDPDVKRAAADEALDLEKTDIEFKSMPGSTSTTLLKVQNGSDETLNIIAKLALPTDLQSKVLDGVRGTDMDCTPWVTVEPSRFTLQGEGGTQTVRITVAMPESAVKCPNYYTDLNFWSYYTDSQSAGRTRAKLIVTNLKAEQRPKAYARKLVSIHLSESKYNIVGGFNNPGLTHFAPIRVKASITAENSTVPRVSALLRNLAHGYDYMLPFEERDFAGTLDISPVEPGTYRLSVAMQYLPDPQLPWAGRQVQVKVTDEGGRKVLETIGVQEDLKSILDVDWK